MYVYKSNVGFAGGASGKEPTCQCRRHKRHKFNPWVMKIPGGGHDNPLYYSCLENPMDRGAWWATVHGLTKSQTRLRWLGTRTHTQKQHTRVTLPSPHHVPSPGSGTAICPPGCRSQNSGALLNTAFSSLSSDSASNQALQFHLRS